MEFDCLVTLFVFIKVCVPPFTWQKDMSKRKKQNQNNTVDTDWLKCLNTWDKRKYFLFTWHILARCWEQTNLARPLKSLGHLLHLKLKLTTAKSLQSSLLGHSFLKQLIQLRHQESHVCILLKYGTNPVLVPWNALGELSQKKTGNLGSS